MSTRCPPPAFEKKICTMEELSERAAALPKPVVFTNGVFDIHSDRSVKMLGKGDDRPINTEADRAAVVAALESTDLVVVFTDKVPLEAVEKARPDIYVKGGDYRIEDLPEAKLVAAWGGRTVTVTFEHERSTTALLRKVRGGQ